MGVKYSKRNKEKSGQIAVTYQKIPSYLHKSQFYLSLNSEDKEPLYIPADCFKESDELLHCSNWDTTELSQLLRTMVFWGLDEIPNSVLDCVRSGWMKRRTLEMVTSALPDNNRLQSLLVPYSRFRNITTAVQSGQPELVRHWIKQHDPKWEIRQPTVDAAELGNLSLLKELHEQHGYLLCDEACVSAIKIGHLEILKYLLNNMTVYASGWCSTAARNDRLDCLRYLHENGCVWDEAAVCNIAAERGSFSCLEYAFENGCMFTGKVTSCKTIECLTLVLDSGCAIEEDACYDALTFRCSLGCFQTLREHGASWDDEVLSATMLREVDFLQYAMENGCPYEDTIVHRANTDKRFEHLEYMTSVALLSADEVVFSKALIFGSIRCVQYLVDCNCPCEFEMQTVPRDVVLCDAKIKQCVQYVVEHGYPCNESLSKFVFENLLPLCQEYLSDLLET